MNSDDRGILDFHAPHPYHGTLSIEVFDREKMKIEADINSVSQQRINDAKEQWGEISLLENKKLNNSWDWYYAFNGVLWDLDFQVRTYLKQTDSFLYIMKLRFVEGEFNDTNMSQLEQIPEVFEFHTD